MIHLIKRQRAYRCEAGGLLVFVELRLKEFAEVLARLGKFPQRSNQAAMAQCPTNFSLSFQVEQGSTLWSALTCQRFGRSRIVATMLVGLLQRVRRQAATDQSGDRSPHSKGLTTLSEVPEVCRTSKAVLRCACRRTSKVEVTF
jgi:hypothetical protein